MEGVREVRRFTLRLAAACGNLLPVRSGALPAARR